MVYQRRSNLVRLGVSAFACLALVATLSLPSAANSVIGGKALNGGRTPRAMSVQHLPGVNPAQTHHFSVILRTSTSADAQAVATYFRNYGMQVYVASTNRALRITSTFGRSAAAAGVQFERVKIGNDIVTRTTHSPRFPYDINRRILATSISPGTKMRELNVRPQAAVVGPQTGYGPPDFASIYDINPVYTAGIDGKGSTVDIAACFNIDPADITFYQNAYGLPNNKVNIIHIDGTLDQFGNVPFPSLEPTLDVEQVMGAAPNAKINLYLVPDCLISQFVDMFTAIAEDENANALSVSYGLPEADYGVLGIGDLVVAQSAALQGVADEHIAIFAASGDSGSWGDSFTTGLVNFLDVLYPASDPNVLSVGGTTLEETVIRTRLFEYAWSGSGGGVSGIFPIPSWQAGTPGLASGLFKNLPDVSADADPNTGVATAFLVSIPPPIFPVGGTSASSPQWAGIMALVNENRHAHGHAPLNNTAASLYSLRGSAAYYDITVGANGYFAAQKGYDNATGLGVPDVAKLVKALQ